MSYKVEVTTNNGIHWASNAIRLPSREEAEAYARDLAWRWTSVTDTRVVESEDLAQHRWSVDMASLMPLNRLAMDEGGMHPKTGAEREADDAYWARISQAVELLRSAGYVENTDGSWSKPS